MIRLLGNLAGVAFGRGDLEGALEMSRAVVTAAEEAHGADAPELVRHLANVGNVQIQAGRAKEAGVAFGRALSVAEKHWKDDDPRLEPVLIGLATVAEQEGRLAAALAHYEHAHQVAQATADAARLEQIAGKVADLRTQLDAAG